MKKVEYKNSFKKDLTKVEQYASFNEDILKDYVNLISSNQQLPRSAHNHPLSKASPKKYKGLWDFHIAPDICVLYENNKDNIVLIRIGKHNNLGLTEDLTKINLL